MLRRPGSSWGFGALLKAKGLTSSHGIESGESAGQSLPPPTIPSGPETRTHNLWVTSPTLCPLGHDFPKYFLSNVYSLLHLINEAPGLHLGLLQLQIIAFKKTIVCCQQQTYKSVVDLKIMDSLSIIWIHENNSLMDLCVYLSLSQCTLYCTQLQIFKITKRYCMVYIFSSQIIVPALKYLCKRGY